MLLYRVDSPATQASGGLSECRRVKKIEAILLPATFDRVATALRALSTGLLAAEVRTWSRDATRKRVYRGIEYEAPLTKLKVEMLVPEQQVREVIEILSAAVETANPPLEESVQVYDVAQSICLNDMRRAR